ncbi:SspB family protein [Pontivivens insulae]|uniref:Stringent starvation protein B n=1 Tax=Pontivivens insulae TaxID=1639689 RepID=A0A2R8ACA2_9RHOB|nr:ClpXP protease specificity-enhancing factor SspB [Pontivivens insulae]RED13737.1 hypothetical protein DFR53_1079 [Pontivivens insulae]SPF29812.1 hypothetical protein POI8812_02133 [Pontivivens insulae]
MPQTIDYAQMMQTALRGLLRDVLERVAVDGLPGEHHFFITFDTSHPGVDLADWLRERYPDEMTIVMQEWFDNLSVMEDRFAITLNFGNSPEPMVIPFAAVQTFVDPSVEFGLRFESVEAEDTPDEADPIAALKEAAAQPDEAEAEPEQSGSADVVSLDAFRKS